MSLIGGSGLLGASLQGRRLSGWEPITPGGFDEHPPHVSIARLGHRAPLPAGAAGMLAGHQTDKGHKLACLRAAPARPLDPRLGFLYRVYVFLKDDLPGRMREAPGLQPAKVSPCPATATGIDTIVTLRAPMATR